MRWLCGIRKSVSFAFIHAMRYEYDLGKELYQLYIINILLYPSIFRDLPFKTSIAIGHVVGSGRIVGIYNNLTQESVNNKILNIYA